MAELSPSKQMSVAEAMTKAREYDKKHEDVPSVSRTLANEIERLKRDRQVVMDQRDRYLEGRQKAHAEIQRLRDIINPGEAAGYEEGMAATEARLKAADAENERLHGLLRNALHFVKSGCGPMNPVVLRKQIEQALGEAT